jgi:hypothetical protein
MPEQFEMRSIHLLSSSFKESKKDEENWTKSKKNHLKYNSIRKNPGD